MSKHTFITPKGIRFEWDDDDPQPWSDERQLLELCAYLGTMKRYVMYEGKDPYSDWNGFIAELRGEVVQRLIDLRAGDV